MLEQKLSDAILPIHSADQGPRIPLRIQYALLLADHASGTVTMQQPHGICSQEQQSRRVRSDRRHRQMLCLLQVCQQYSTSSLFATTFAGQQEHVELQITGAENTNQNDCVA